MMQHRVWIGALAWAAALAGSLSCADCNREGCAGLARRAPEGPAGIAGVVARLEDVVVDGCGECPLAAATLQLWNLEMPFERRSDVAALVAARPPDLTRDVAGHYTEPLEPGWYLLCVRPNCVELNIHEDETLTVNVQRRDGPTSFFVGRPGAGRLDEDFGFDVGY